MEKKTTSLQWFLMGLMVGLAIAIAVAWTDQEYHWLTQPCYKRKSLTNDQ